MVNDKLCDLGLFWGTFSILRPSDFLEDFVFVMFIYSIVSDVCLLRVWWLGAVSLNNETKRP